MGDLHKRSLILIGDYDRWEWTTAELISCFDKSKDVFPVDNRHYSNHKNSFRLIIAVRYIVRASTARIKSH